MEDTIDIKDTIMDMKYNTPNTLILGRSLINNHLINKGIIYLVQPPELVGINRYKIGMSNNLNLNRCKNRYKKGSRYICIMECMNASILKEKIKKEFNIKFKLIAGNEYYEGNENEILTTFNNLVINHHQIFNL